MDENRIIRKKSGRELARRRKGLEEANEGQVEFKGFRKFWEKFGKQFFFTLVFATSIVFICFFGQDPPSLRSLGEVAPENIYSDRSFTYESEIRKKEAEEWIRSSTPRESSRNLVGEESFKNALSRLEEGLILLSSMDNESRVLAEDSLREELLSNFNLEITNSEISSLLQWRILLALRVF